MSCKANQANFLGMGKYIKKLKRNDNNFKFFLDYNILLNVTNFRLQVEKAGYFSIINMFFLQIGYDSEYHNFQP